MGHAQLVAGDQHRVAGEARIGTRFDATRDVDAADQRKAADDLAGAVAASASL